jgi:hypothetical protein
LPAISISQGSWKAPLTLKFLRWLTDTSPEPLPALRGDHCPPSCNGEMSLRVRLPFSLSGTL